MRLFIAEKPSVARAIATELGGGEAGGSAITCGSSVITWCFGHMLQQAEPDAYTPQDVPRGESGRKLWRIDELPVVPGRWRLEPVAKTRSQLRTIGRLLSQANEVVHAGDPDREGQLLVDEVLEHFGNRLPVRRFWATAQDPESIRRALASLGNNSDFAGMANAARGRQRADWLIGMNLSRAYTLRAQRGGSKALLTVGRVQTPTLSLVVARDREIEGFVPRPYHVVTAEFQHAGGRFSARLVPDEAKEGLDPEGRLVDRAVADRVVAEVTGRPARISLHEERQLRRPPPPAFSLADLTVQACQQYGFGAEQTLQLCQALYGSRRLSSYPRTDCGYLPASQHRDAPRVLQAIAESLPELGGQVGRADPTVMSPTWNDARVTAHHGIIPTMQGGRGDALSEPERLLYALIARRYLAQFYPDHAFVQTNVTLEVEGHRFVATGKRVTELGWKTVYEAPAEPAPQADRGPGNAGQAEGTDPGEPGEQAELPEMRRGDLALCAAATRNNQKTKPPPRFTEGSLTRAMEQIHRWAPDPADKRLLRQGDGIGTSATRASILGDLKKRKFLRARGKTLVSTALGRALCDGLPPSVKRPALTALYERMLGDIEAGLANLDDFVERQAQFVAARVTEAGQGSLDLGSAQPQAARRGHSARRRRRTVPAERRRTGRTPGPQ